MTNLERLERYSVVINNTEDGFVAHYRELGHSATGHGGTAAAALADLRAASSDLAEFIEEDFPEATELPLWNSFSGRVTLRIPKSLHWRLVELAECEGVSLNGLMADVLRDGAAARSSSPEAPVSYEGHAAERAKATLSVAEPKRKR